MHDLRRTLYHHIHRLSLAQHDEKRTGDLIGRVTDDIDRVQDFVTSALLSIVANVLTLAGIIGVMLYLNWRLTLIALAIAPALFGVVYVFTRRIKKASRDVRKKESELMSMVEEVFSSIRVVKAFAREDYEQQRFERQSLANVGAARQARAITMELSPLVDIILAIGTCLMLAYGAAGRRRAVDGRRARGLPALPRQDVQADAGPLEDDGHRIEGGGRIRADPRSARDGGGCPRPAPRASGRRLQGRHRLRSRLVRISPGHADPRRRELLDRARAGRRLRRADGERQDDHHQPGGALL